MVKKRSKSPRRRNYTDVMFHLLLIVFQGCKREHVTDDERNCCSERFLRHILTIFEPAFRWAVQGATQACQGQGIAFPAILENSILRTSSSRTGASLKDCAALILHQGIKVPMTLMRGDIFLCALHLALITSLTLSHFVNCQTPLSGSGTLP